jgi:tRNA(Ile)-lysidine synthetase-like protein
MDVELKPGIYVVAVSGGVDSMVLLDMLRQKPGLKLIVAHFDHGIRPDSELDRELVQKYAKSHHLAFVYDEGRLGSEASEATARDARYEFLRKVKKVSGAKAIITAHHQDDLIETAILNLLRGTGRKGLSSLAETGEIKRPLLHVPKKDLIAHARKHKLGWREDATNLDTRYRRNYVRQHIVNRLSAKQRQNLLKLLEKTKITNQEIDYQIANFLQFIEKDKEIDRKMFIALPHAVALEVMAGWLRGNNVRQFDQKLLKKLVTGAKTLPPGKRVDVDAGHIIKTTKRSLQLLARDR